MKNINLVYLKNPKTFIFKSKKSYLCKKIVTQYEYRQLSVFEEPEV